MSGSSLVVIAEAMKRFAAPEGGYVKALDGVSLTVNQVEDEADGAVRFGVNIIPHTARQTTFGGLTPGVRVNLEIDLLARYVQRLTERAG